MKIFSNFAKNDPIHIYSTLSDPCWPNGSHNNINQLRVWYRLNWHTPFLPILAYFSDFGPHASEAWRSKMYCLLTFRHQGRWDWLTSFENLKIRPFLTKIEKIFILILAFKNGNRFVQSQCSVEHWVNIKKSIGMVGLYLHITETEIGKCIKG